MTVGELIELLSECDPEATVRIMMQQSWPFENAIDGIAIRSEMGGEECECDHRIDEPHEEGCPAENDKEYGEGLAGNDVFIVEGRQERYGNKDAWAVSRRH
jgi:hypothetical protein